jgi:hypothetical protein
MVFVTFLVTVVVVFVVSSFGNIKGKFLPVNVLTTQGGVEVYLHTFLTSALDGSEWPVSGVGFFR